MKKLIFLTLLVFFIEVNGRVLIQVDPKIEICVDKSKRLGAFDVSQLEFVPENDTHSFINGTTKIAKDINAPLHALFTCEYYMRGEWVMRGCNRTIPDMCVNFKMPTEPWFYITKDYKTCPWKAGHELVFNMVPIQFPEHILDTLPSSYLGRWRGVGQFFQRKKNGELDLESRECIRAYFTVFDD